MNELKESFQNLVNNTLPATYQSPVKSNHCFNRIILDWLFQNCWYHYLDRKKTAISQLNEKQLESAITRMNEWLANVQVLVRDNSDSLRYRNKCKQR